MIRVAWKLLVVFMLAASINTLGATEGSEETPKSVKDAEEVEISKIQIVSSFGDVSVHFIDSGDVEVHGASVDTSDGVLTISATRSSLDARVPLAPDVFIKAVSGNVEVKGDIESVDEPIDMVIRAMSGDIDLYMVVQSNLTLTTISGDITIQDHNVPLTGWENTGWNITTVSGDIAIYAVIPTNLQLNAVSGDVVIELDSIPTSIDSVTYEINTAGGSLHISPEPEDHHLGVITINVEGIEMGEVMASPIEELTGEEKAGVEGVKERFRLFSPHFKGLENVLGYNRVDGLWLGADFDVSDEHVGKANIGFRYAFGRKKLQGWGGLSIPILREYPKLILEGRIFSATATYDRWLIDDTWNFVTASIVKLDYRDYFHRRGTEFGLAVQPVEGVELEFLHEKSRFEPLEVHDDWSLFYRKSRTFRPNPMMDSTDFEANKLRITAALEPIVSAAFEASFGDFGDISFKRYFGMAKVEESFGAHKVGISLIAGMNDPSLPFPFEFGLGGYGTLYAFDFKEFKGDKFLLIRPNYSISIEGHKFNLTAELGKITDVNGSIADADLHADVGFGVNLAEHLRLMAYYPLTDNLDRFKVFLELN